MKLNTLVMLILCLLAGCASPPASEKQISETMKAMLARDTNLVGFQIFGSWTYNKARTRAGHPVRLSTRSGASYVLELEYKLTSDSGWRYSGESMAVDQ